MKYAVQFYDGYRLQCDEVFNHKREAIKVYNEYLYKFYKNLESSDPLKQQLALWEDVLPNGAEYPVYHKAIRELDSYDYEYIRGKVCKIDTELPELDMLYD